MIIVDGEGAVLSDLCAQFPDAEDQGVRLSGDRRRDLSFGRQFEGVKIQVFGDELMRGCRSNNDLDDGGPFFDIQYDGFTDVFLAQALKLSEGTHHIKLAIADASDLSLDSAVFIQAGSFSDQPPEGQPPTTVPEPSTLLLLSSGVAGLWVAGRKRMGR